MRRLLPTLVLLFGICLAQSLPRVLSDEQAVVDLIRSSEWRVMLLTPKLYGKSIAKALKNLTLERGIPVLILTEPSATTDRASLIPALSLLKRNGHPLEVRLLQRVSRTRLILDDARLVIGPLITGSLAPGSLETRLDLDGDTARREARNFLIQWRRAKPWMLEVRNPQFKGGSK
jgi:hypothetical protein